MNPIRPLPTSVIQTIAAGEVIERPANVVKELIENALDAGATQIKIDLDHSGLRRIKVSDNGHGIPVEELALALTPHATSKLNELDDLLKLTSFGFRGEALASITRVSRVTLQSRTKTNESGFQLYSPSDHQPFAAPQPLGMPTGTSVIVEFLFHNLPVRLKFLKNPATELRHVLQTVTQAALGQPQVSFHLTHNRQPLLNLPSHATTLERILAVLGYHLQRHLIPLVIDSPNFKISGYLSTPQGSQQHKGKQYMFINGRPVEFPALAKTIKQAYGTLLSATTPPSFVVYLELPPQQLDINIHPQKTTINVVGESDVLATIKDAAAQALRQTDTTYYYSLPPERPLSFHDSGFEQTLTASPHTAHILKILTERWQTQPGQPTPILQLADTYLLTLDDQGLVMVDQHAAHERILYEQFVETWQTYQQADQPHELNPAQLLELSALEHQALATNHAYLEKIGFRWEEFGPTTIKVTHIPSLLADRPVAELLIEVANELNSRDILSSADQTTDSTPNPLDHQTSRTLKFLACRQAIKAGQPLSSAERQRLIEQLAITPNHATCPHGRPTTIHFDVPYLEKMFRRRN